MGDKFEGIVIIIVSLATYFFLIKGVIPFLESIADRASLAQAKFEREKREAIRQAEERKKELEKERQIQCDPDRSVLRSGTDRAQTGIWRDLRAGKKQLKDR